ncbi:MAG TPA: MlaD family protein [Thermoanaerobaculia bacterium]|nr:MlaD family protein [Thermoanaerobaculia bacterium]
MSEYDQHDVERRRTPPPEARVHLAKWSPWIWIVPALAVFLAGFLIVRYGYFGGGDITVRFADARGLDRYSPVRFRGAKVGTVQNITIDSQLKQVVVRITMDASMGNALRTGTRFWIVEPGLEGGGISGLLGGTYVGIAPGGGDSTRDFKGQEYAPVLTPPGAGKTFILETNGVDPIAVGAPVQFHGIRAGLILGSEYDDARRVTDVHAFVVQRFVNHVTASTRFWRAGAISLSLSGGAVTMSGASLSSLLSSPVEFFTPDVLPGPPAADGTRFQLLDSEQQAEAAAGGEQFAFVTYFPGAIGGLQPGAKVQMRGVDVGFVRDVRLRYVPQTASLETPVTITIDPSRLELPADRAALDGAIARLVAKGMRATLNSSLILPGASGVSLDFVANPGSARLALDHDPPIIPAAATGSGVNDLLARLSALPIEDIASHLQSTVARVDQLVHDPALSDSLHRLNASLADVQKVAAVTRENVGPITASLRNAASAAEQAAGRANQLLATAPQQNYDLGSLIKELTRAAESIRALSDYLTEHPDALLKGRAK